MATITIDGKQYEVDPNRNLLDVCLSLGLDLPYFCWHPSMGSVGACRQCAVIQYQYPEDESGRLVMACMAPATDGTRISLEHPRAKAFRETVIEWLMANHPHDCPVCDEGGECHLQDMTVMTGHTYRRFRFNKRTYQNQYLGPLINHEMNRCIQCYRCVRYYRDLAGGRDLDVFAAHDHVYFGRHEDGVLESEFSGNLVEVCPTGVFTDKTLKRHYTRKWDLQTAPSVCVNCGVGCNTIPGERYGELRRIRNGYNRQVNGYFLCDRGRYGYEFVNSPRRIIQAKTRKTGDAEPMAAPSADVVEEVGRLLRETNAIGIGSPRASLEGNFALHELVGPERFCRGVSRQEGTLLQTALEILQSSPVRSPSLHEMETADGAFVLGEDLINTAPMAAHALRQTVRQQPMEIPERLGIPSWDDAAVREAVQDERGPLFLATLAGTKLEDIARATYHGAPEDLARLGFAVAHRLDPQAPEVEGLSDEERELAAQIAAELDGCERPVVVSGTSAGLGAVMQAAASIARALNRPERPASLSLVAPECNSLGLELMGGGDLEDALAAVESGEVETVIVLENDLYRRARAEIVDALFEAASHVIAIDHLENATSLRAGHLFPAATFAEGDGTLVNYEGRAQRFLQVFQPASEIQESWRWLRDLSVASGEEAMTGWAELDHVLQALASAFPVFEPVLEITPPSEFRMAGQRIPRQPHRYSGRTAIIADITVHEPKPPEDPDTPLAFSMEGVRAQPPAGLIPRYWAPAWNSVQALNKFQAEVGGPLSGGDPGRRLIEPVETGGAKVSSSIPAAFEPRSGQWRLVPLYHIFGSGELSVHSPGIAELAPAPYLALNPEDAAALGAAEGSQVALRRDEGALPLPVRIDPTLPAGLVGYPVGLRDLPLVDPPTWVEITMEEAA